VSYRAPHGGGVSAYVSQLSNRLEARGHRVTALDLGDSTPEVRPETPHCLRLPSSYGPVQGWRLRPALRHLLSEETPEIIHVHGCFTTLSSVLLKDLQRHAPVVATLHDIRPFCYLMTRRFTRTGGLCHRRCGFGCFSSGCVKPSRWTDIFRLPRRWAVDLLNLRRWRKLDRVVVPSAYLRDLALQHGFPPRSLRLIPHGTAVLSSSPSATRKDTDPPLILFLGGLLREKGPDLFIQALGRLRARPWRAILVGDGPMRMALEHDVKRNALVDRVRILGHIEEREIINDLLTRARLLVLPSIIPESFSLAGIEALAAGTPVVSFGLGGLGEWLRDGENGLIVADGDVVDLAYQIGRLLDDPAFAQRLGKRGYQLVAQRFTEDLAFERLFAVYRETIATRRKK